MRDHDEHETYAPETHEHDLGLSHDLGTLLDRRRALGLVGGLGLAAALTACGSSGGDGSNAATSSTPSTTTSTGTSTGTTSATTEIPEETGGPYPADGSNGVNVLTESGIVRSDLRTSFGTGSATAQGVPLTITLKVLDVSSGGSALAGAAVYLWHCDRDGRYSMYDQEIANENYLRGVQETASDGSVTFTSIYPAAYSGRWPHIHFEVYPSVAKATSASDKLRTSQLALPEAQSKLVYATDGYSRSVTNLAQTSLATDNVFSDGYSLQLATVTGSVGDGMVATLNVPV